MVGIKLCRDIRFAMQLFLFSFLNRQFRPGVQHYVSLSQYATTFPKHIVVPLRRYVDFFRGTVVPLRRCVDFFGGLSYPYADMWIFSGDCRTPTPMCGFFRGTVVPLRRCVDFFRGLLYPYADMWIFSGDCCTPTPMCGFFGRHRRRGTTIVTASAQTVVSQQKP